METSGVRAGSTDTQREILRKYYLETDYFISTEGILKILSIIVCTVSSISLLWGGWCHSSSGAGGAGVSTLLAAALLALCPCAAFTFAEYAPMTCFVIDLVLYTLVGVSLFLIAILSLTLCEFRRFVDYFYGPLALINSGLVISSATMTFISVTKRWDLESGATNHTARQDSNELEV